MNLSLLRRMVFTTRGLELRQSATLVFCSHFFGGIHIMIVCSLDYLVFCLSAITGSQV